MIRILLLSLFIMIAATAASAQQAKPGSQWDAWQFLLGEWVAEGEGAPGQATGGFSFNLDLQGRILVRKNHADYPASKERPAFAHDDLMIIYLEAEGRLVRAIYFDNEGHVIQYTVSFAADGKTITLLRDVSPAAPRFRFIYTKGANDTLTTQFDLAPPGKPEAFTKYVTGTARRKRAD